MAQSPLPKEHAGLRVIAVLKFIKGTLLLVVGFGAFRLLNRDLAEVARLWAHRFSIDPENRMAHWVIREASAVEPRNLRHFGYIVLIFATDQLIEGVGLWLNQAWAKYLLLVATSLAFCWEGFILIRDAFRHTVSYWHLGTMGVTIAILVYLVIIFRLDHQRRNRKT